MQTNRQPFLKIMIVACVIGCLPQAGLPLSNSLRSPSEAQPILVAEKPFSGNISLENENAPSELKQIKIYLNTGNSVTMHSGAEELKIEETTQLGIKGKTDFVVSGDARFEFPGKEDRLEVNGTGAHVEFDNGPDVRVSGATSVDARDGISVIASKCKKVDARDKATVVASYCAQVMVRSCKGTVSNCQSVEFREQASGTSADCPKVSVRESTVQIDNCSSLAVRGESKVTAQNCSKVEARDNAEVRVRGVQSIEARDTARVFYTGSPQIELRDTAVARRI